MTRAQRRAHALAWMVIAPLLLVALGWAIARRAAMPTQDPPAALGAEERAP